MMCWNIAGMKEYSELNEFIKKFEIVSLIETWIEDKDKIRVTNRLSSEMKWWFKAAVRKKECKRGRASGGRILGVKKEKEAEWKVDEWEYGFVIKNKQMSEVVITVYNNVGIRAIEKQFKKVVRDNEGTYEKIIVIGDLNARIGECETKVVNQEYSIKRKSKDKVVNAEGKKLLNMCEDLGLRIINGASEGDRNGEVTFIGGKSENCCSVIDICMVMDRGSEDCIKKFGVIKKTDSDHLPIYIEIKRKNSDNKATNGEEKTGLTKIMEERMRWKKDQAAEYAENAYEIWSEKRMGEEGLEWSELKETIYEAARRTKMTAKPKKGKATGKQKKEWFNEKCKRCRNTVWDKLRIMLKDAQNNEKKKEYIEARKAYRQAIKEAKENWWLERKKEIDKAKDMSKWWEAVNKFRCKRTKKEMGEKIDGDTWVKHFSKLLNKNNNNTEVDSEINNISTETSCENDCMDEEISRREFREAIKKLGNKKAPGEDEISAEFIKNLPREMLENLNNIINKMWEEGSIQEGWEKARIVTIHKAGDIKSAENYRGISLLDIGYKILTTIMAERLMCWTDRENKIKESQAGFRKGRGTREHIFTLNALINNRLKNKKNLYVCFVDLKQAFDTVDRKLLLQKLQKIGIGGKMYKMIETIYKNTTCEVTVNGAKTKVFKINQGVRQGCALSAVLFNIFIDDMEDEMVRKNIGGTVMGKTKIYMTKYADDGAAIADTPEGLKEMLKEIEKYADKNRLKVNAKKTKIMVFKNGGRAVKNEWCYKGEKLEVVNNFKYLGYTFTTKNTHNKHMREMKNKANKVSNATWGVIRRTGRDNIEDRIYLYNTLVRSGCLYGVETWGCEKTSEMVIMQNKLWRMALGVSRNTPSYIVYKETRSEMIEVLIKDRLWRYIINIVRMGEDRWPKICLREEMRGILNRQPSKWGEKIKMLVKEMECERIIELIYNNAEIEVIEEEIKNGLEVYKKMMEKKVEEKINNSTYNNLYKKLVLTNETENYWCDKEVKNTDKEIWARARCGNLTRAGKKGISDWKCRECKSQEETLAHVLMCEKISKKLSEESKKTLETWNNYKECEKIIEIKIIECLNSKICKNVCKLLKEIEKVLRESESENREESNITKDAVN
ncbi:GSCOCG00001987001-RA-CDS [Cotesia congregata]|nr:GSCOCG00001987001-RA-CDS [Cotesia congregata]